MLLNQHQFGKKLRCSSITVSRWERGLQPPSTDHLLALGRMVGRSSGWYFWKMAGIDKEDVRRMLVRQA
jgi:transcriptional regulator with XRE-family HTH domain